MLLSTLILLPFTLTGRRSELRQMGRAKWGLAVLSGALLGLHFATWTSSLALTSITSSTVLVATAPLWVGLASPFLLNEPLSRALKLGIALAMVGTLIVSMGGGSRSGERPYFPRSGRYRRRQPAVAGQCPGAYRRYRRSWIFDYWPALTTPSFFVELYDCCVWHGCDDIASF